LHSLAGGVVPTFDSDCEWKNTLALPNGCLDGDGEINAEIICFIVSPGVAMNFLSPLYGYLFLLGPVGSQGAVCMTRWLRIWNLENFLSLTYWYFNFTIFFNKGNTQKIQQILNV